MLHFSATLLPSSKLLKVYSWCGEISWQVPEFLTRKKKRFSIYNKLMFYWWVSFKRRRLSIDPGVPPVLCNMLNVIDKQVEFPKSRWNSLTSYTLREAPAPRVQLTNMQIGIWVAPEPKAVFSFSPVTFRLWFAPRDPVAPAGPSALLGPWRDNWPRPPGSWWTSAPRTWSTAPGSMATRAATAATWTEPSSTSSTTTASTQRPRTRTPDGWVAGLILLKVDFKG